MKLKLRQKIYGTVAALILFCSTTPAEALSVDKIHVSKNVEGPNGDYRITSMNEQVMQSDYFHLNSQMGMHSNLYIAREDGKWDKDFLLTSKFYTYEDKEVQNSLKELKFFMKRLDNILPDEKIIAICYWIDFREVTIYFNPERWKDKEFHKNVVKKLKK